MEWFDAKAYMARRGGIGDILTPVPCMETFFRLLESRKALFRQEEYYNDSVRCWKERLTSWPAYQNDEIMLGLKVRLYRNFYVSAIDQLHVWSLLVETGKFDSAYIDTMDDAIGKTDITVIDKSGTVHRINLFAGSLHGCSARDYKAKYRLGAPITGNIWNVELRMDRPKGVGNKRWYQIEDFEFVGEPELDLEEEFWPF